MVEGVNGYGILTDIGTCLNHLKYPVTHNLISYRDYHQSLLLHMHSPLGGIVHAFLLSSDATVGSKSTYGFVAHMHEIGCKTCPSKIQYINRMYCSRMRLSCGKDRLTMSDL